MAWLRGGRQPGRQAVLNETDTAPSEGALKACHELKIPFGETVRSDRRHKFLSLRLDNRHVVHARLATGSGASVAKSSSTGICRTSIGSVANLFRRNRLRWHRGSGVPSWHGGDQQFVPARATTCFGSLTKLNVAPLKRQIFTDVAPRQLQSGPPALFPAQ